MTNTNTLARFVHDAGLAAWFGGSLFGVAALNPASEELDTPGDALRVSNSAWGRWTVWNGAAIASHLVAGGIITYGNKSRLTGQRGVASTATLKTGLTLAALGATAYARKLGQEIMDYETVQRSFGNEPAAEGATTPAPETPDHIAEAQRKEKTVKWLVPALTGALLAVNVWMGEQQRPSKVAKGVLGRVLPD
jgi:hypothetical protein